MTQIPENNIPKNRKSRETKGKKPYHKLTLEEVKQDYQDGLITATGYLYYILKTTRKDGWRFKIESVRDFCREHGLSRSAFYKAVKVLQQKRDLNFEVDGKMDLWLGAEFLSIREKVSTNGDTQSTIVDTQSTNGDTQSTIVDTDPLETPGNKASQNPYRSSTDLFTDLLHTNLPPTPGVCVSSSVLFLDPDSQSEETPSQKTSDAKIPDQIQTSKLKPGPQEVEIPADFLSRMKKLGVNLGDRELQAALHRYPGRVEDAIAAAEEKRDELRYPTSFLKRAIDGNWKPEHTGTTAPIGFNEWMAEAKRRNLVYASQVQNNIIYVYAADPENPHSSRAFKFEELRRKSWDEIEATIRPITVEADVLGDENCIEVSVLSAEAEAKPVDPADRLAVFRAQWACCDAATKTEIIQLIQQHPEWELDIGPDGPRMLAF